MKKITIVRKSEFTNRIRNYEVYADDKIIAKVANGEEITLLIPEHTKELYCKIDWCGSNRIAINQLKENERLYVRSYKLNDYVNYLFIITLILIAISYLTNLEFYHNWVFMLPAFLIMIYHITIGRNQYLDLKSSNNKGA